VPGAGLGTRLFAGDQVAAQGDAAGGGKTVVQYVVEESPGWALQRVLFITGPGKNSIENHFDLNEELIRSCARAARRNCWRNSSSSARRCRVLLHRPRELLGLGHAILCSEPFVGNQPFVAALGDSIIGMHARSDIERRMTRCFAERGAAVRDRVFEQVPWEGSTATAWAKPGGGRTEVFEVRS
jgi:UTP--glucose-1-phosphate uridylyltransferase